MSNFKEATKRKLRFHTSKGMLSVEQLWDLSRAELSRCIKAVKKAIKKDDDDELSFLDDAVTVNTEDELRFNVLKEVYLELKSEAEAQRNQLERKEHNAKILAIIQDKREDSLKGKSIEELEAMLA